jgi:hypothetical protein
VAEHVTTPLVRVENYDMWTFLHLVSSVLVLIPKPMFSDERGQPSAISFQQKIFDFLMLS